MYSEGVLLSLLVGCASHSFLNPGPLAGLGREPIVERSPAKTPAKTPAVRPPRPRQGDGDAVAAAAQSFLGDRRLVALGETYRFDCSGFVGASLAKAGFEASGSSADLFEHARERGVLHRRNIPEPGDVAFFDHTYDRNRNGQVDDPLSHVAVVESVEADGTIHLVHVGSDSVGTFLMNLRHPSDRADQGGKRINDRLRVEKRSDPAGTDYLAAELFVGFGSFWKAGRRLVSKR